MLREDSVLEVVKGLDATPDMIKANQNKEQGSLKITDNKDGTFTMNIGHAKNTFKIDEWFEHSFQGGASNLQGKCR